MLRATVYFTMNSKHKHFDGKTDGGPQPQHSLAEILLIVFFGETFVRSLLHLITQILSAISKDAYKYLLNPFFRLEDTSSSRSLRHRGNYGRIDTRILDGTTDEGDEEFVGKL